jgi:hypothetical protein
MTAKEAINKIADLLNLKFKAEKFYSTELTNGTEVTNNLEGDFQIGQVLYVVGESTLTPAPAGEHVTREGLKLTLDTESVIISIESADKESDSELEQETGDVEMTRAEDAEGKIVESPTFDVGEPLSIVKEDGSLEPAPNGEYQVVLKDESGNENKIRVQVVDGIIVERSNVEEMSIDEEIEKEPKLEDVIELILPLVEEMKKMKEQMTEMKGKMTAEMSALKNDFDGFKKSPEKFSVVEKKTYKDNWLDYKLELIKGATKK